VLRPGGRFYYVEHGLSPDPGVARWQHRLNPIQNFIAGGCNLTRDIAGLVTAAGFVLEEAETGYVKGPKPLTYLYRGVAKAPAASTAPAAGRAPAADRAPAAGGGPDAPRA
jgi:hypothetical protein